MSMLLQLTLGGVVTVGTLLVLASTLSRFGGVGVVELLILLIPAGAAGLWVTRATRRVHPRSRSR